MNELTKKIIVPLSSAVVGGLAVVFALKFSPSMGAIVDPDKTIGSRSKLSVALDDDFFNQNDPFEELNKMRKQMEKFGKRNTFPNDLFDFWKSEPSGFTVANEIAKREDDNFVYYDIKVEDANSTSINTKIENGYITVSGTLEKKNGRGNLNEKEDSVSQSYFKSTFNRTFPLPDQVDQNKMQTITEGNKIVLKFPKTKS